MCLDCVSNFDLTILNWDWGLSPVFQGQHNLPPFHLSYDPSVFPKPLFSSHHPWVYGHIAQLRVCVRVWAEADVDIFQFTCRTCGDVGPSCALLACQGSRMCAERRIDTVRHLPLITRSLGRWRHQVERRIAARHAPLLTSPPSRSVLCAEGGWSAWLARPVKSGGVNLSWRLRRWHETETDRDAGEKGDWVEEVRAERRGRGSPALFFTVTASFLRLRCGCCDKWSEWAQPWCESSCWKQKEQDGYELKLYAKWVMLQCVLWLKLFD